MYIYHVLNKALSAHVIHINLNVIFYTHVEHSPAKTIYIKYCKNKITKNTTNTNKSCTAPVATGYTNLFQHWVVNFSVIYQIHIN